MSTRTSGRNGKASRASGSNAPAVQADREDQAGSSTRSQALAQKDGPSNYGEYPRILVTLDLTCYKQTGDNHQPGDRRTPSDTTQPMPPEMPHVIGDFDDNANAFWSLHMNEAKSHDEARIQSLKDDMDSVLIFVCIYISIQHFLARADALSPRLVYSPLLSSPLSSIRFTTFKSIQRSKWSITNNRMSPYSLRSLPRSLLSPHRSPFLPLHLHLIPTSVQPRPMSGSTLSGS